MIQIRWFVALAGAAGVFLEASLAEAQTQACPANPIACGDTSQLPSPVFLAGSSAFEPILSLLALQVKAKQGISIIYSPISSCNGISSIYNDPSLGFGTAPLPLTATPHYYMQSPTDPTVSAYCSCVLSGNTYASIGVSDVAFDSCQGVTKPASLGEWLGPEQAMLIVVPEANVTTTAISAEQAGVIWGCGQTGNFPPFNDNNAIQQRSSTSGTQIMVARNIGSSDGKGGYRTVPENAFKGNANSSSSALFSSLLSVPNPQTAIGFLANDFYSTHRAQLNSLAFRGFGQKYAYYADTDSTTDDLLNVREGRYMIQGPLHFFAPLTATLDGGAPAPNPAISLILDWLTGAVPIDSADPGSYVRTVSTNGDVPQCAMKVRISKDGGSFTPYTPPTSCDCAFRRAKSLKIPAGTCAPCTSDATCTGGTRCQTGYCE